MNTKLLIALTLGVSVAATSSIASTVDPETDRQQMVDFFKAKSPKIQFDEYANGAYIYSDQLMAQWEAAEEFPPYLDALDAGEAAWNKDKAVFEKCFGSDLTKIRPMYPLFDEGTQQVVTLEGSINKCRTDAGLKAYKWKKGTLAQVSAYLAYNSRGEKINVVAMTDGAKKAYNEGRDFYLQPRGQLGLSCAKCHTYFSGRLARADMLSPNLGHTTHFPVFRAKWQSLGTLHRRYGGCNQNMRATPFKAQSEEYRNLEFFQAYISNGMDINGPGYRK